MKKTISVILILQTLVCFSQDNFDYSVKRKIDSLIDLESSFFKERNYNESIMICQKLIALGFEESIYKGYKKMLLSRYLKYYPEKDLVTLNEAIEDAKSFIVFMKNSVKYKSDFASIIETYGMMFQLKYELAEIKGRATIFKEALSHLDEAEKLENYIGNEVISTIKFNKAKAYMKIYDLTRDNSSLLTGFNNCQEANDHYSSLTTDDIGYFNFKELLALYHLKLASIETFNYHKTSAEKIISDLDKTYSSSYYYHRIKGIDSLKIKVKKLIKQD